MTKMLTVDNDNSNGLDKGMADGDIGTHTICIAPMFPYGNSQITGCFCFHHLQAIHLSSFHLLRLRDRYTGLIFSVGIGSTTAVCPFMISRSFLFILSHLVFREEGTLLSWVFR